MISPEFEEKCDRILSSIVSGKEFTVSKDNAGELFLAIGNDAVKAENWNEWLKKYPQHFMTFTLEECAMCNGKAEIANVYGGAAYLCGYSDHGHVSWQKCDFCQHGVIFAIENAKNIGACEV